MSLQRGTYGIEFDGQQRSPLRKWWLPAILVLVIGAPLLLLRGCAGRSGPSGQADEAAPGQTRYSVPEVETRRERPSIWRHFLNFGWRGGAARSQQTVDGGTPTAGERWLNAERKTAPATTVQSAEVKSLLEQVARHETADELVRARQVLHQILIRRDADDVRAFVERKIGEINTALLFGDRAMPEKVRHRVASGDLISKLAKRYGTTQAYLLLANGIDRPDRLRIGREIWVLDKPAFELTVFKQTASAVLVLNGQFCKRYSVGLGPAADVPAGTFAVRNKVTEPAYRLPDGGEVPFGHPQNILGTRWITLSATGETPPARLLGLHGTWDVSSLGRASDTGRVRFRNADIEELCVLLPDGAAVAIVE